MSSVPRPDSAPGPKSAVRGEKFVVPLLAMAVVASMVVLLAYRSHLGWLTDDWAFIVGRHDGRIGDFLDPHNEHISVLSVALYRLVLAVFGLGSAMPMHVIATSVFATSAVLLFIYMRRRIGAWPSLIAAVVILFLGVAWEDLLWTFQVGFFMSVTFGLGALLALDRNDRKGDRLACLLLILCILPSSMGLPFIAGAFVEWALNGSNRRRRLYIPAIPALVYAAWYVGWGHTAEHATSLHNILVSPLYVLKAAAEGVSDLTGAFHFAGPKGDALTWLIFAVVLVGTVIHLWRTRNVTASLLVALSIGLTFWFLAGFNQLPGRGFDASRYQYPSAVFILLILSNAFQGVVVRPRYLGALGAIAVVAIAFNMVSLNAGYVNVFRPQTQQDIATLSALQISGPRTNPDAAVGMTPGDTAFINSGGYQAAVSRYGPAVDPSEDLPGLPVQYLQRADALLAGLLPIRARQLDRVPPGAKCQVVNKSAEDGGLVLYRSPGLIFVSSHNARILVSRFAAPLTSPFGIAAAGVPTLVKVRSDSSTTPWQMGLSAEAGRYKVCRVPAQAPAG